MRQERLRPMESLKRQPPACLRKAFSVVGLCLLVFRASELARLRILGGRQVNPEPLQFQKRQNEQKAVLFSSRLFVGEERGGQKLASLLQSLHFGIDQGKNLHVLHIASSLSR